MLAQLYIFRFIEVMIANLLLFDHIHQFSPVSSAAYQLDSLLLLRKSFLMITSYAPRNYSDFNVCFLPLFVCK